MSGEYIAQLLALATGHAAVVEPRQRQRFEPEIGLADPFAAGVTEEEPTVSSPAAGPLSIAPLTSAAPPAMRADPLPACHEPVTVAPEEHASPATIMAAPPTVAMADVPPANRLGQEPQPAPPPVGTPPQAATVAIPQGTASQEARQQAPQSSTIQAVAVLQAALPAEARRGPSPLPPGRRISAHPVPATPATLPSQPPAITIRIDRIDIHAAAPPAPPRPAPAPGMAAPTDLAAYLARRREGGW